MRSCDREIHLIPGLEKKDSKFSIADWNVNVLIPNNIEMIKITIVGKRRER